MVCMQEVLEMYVCVQYIQYTLCKQPRENTLVNTKYITFLRKDPTFQVSDFTTCHLLVDQKLEENGSLESPPYSLFLFF